MKKSYLLLIPFAIAALSGCESGGNNSKPYVTPAKDINSMADFEKMVSDNPINSSASKTPTRYSLNVDLNFKNSDKQYAIKDVELIGNKHRLKNFSINVTNYGGLFSKVNNCIFSDLIITNASVSGDYSGALVGSAEIAIFKNIKIGEQVKIGDGVGDEVGGLVGYAESAEIKGCENNATIEGFNSVGGIVGHAYNTDIISCINNGEISASVVGKGIGGICGTYTNYWRYDAREDTFESNYNYGDVNGQDCDDVGGLIGQHHPQLYLRGSKYPKVTISKCHNLGNVEGRNNVGGIAGSGICDLCDTEFTSCDNKGSVTGKKYVGGIAGYTKDFSVDTPYSQGDELKQVKFKKCKTILNETQDNFVKGETCVGGIAGNGTNFISCENAIEVITALSESPEINDSYLPTEYQHSIGGIVGFGYAEFDLVEFDAQNCVNKGKVSGVSSDKPYKLASSLGGICGLSYGGSFIKCSNSGELNAAQCVGGTVGSLEPRQKTYISENISTGNIIVNRCAGGIIGDIEASEKNSQTIKIAGCNVDIEEALVYGSTPSVEVEPLKFVLGGLIGRANTTASANQYYEITTISNYDVDFKYRSPGDAENLTTGKVVGYNKTNENGKPLVSYTQTYADEHAFITRLGDIE